MNYNDRIDQILAGLPEEKRKLVIRDHHTFIDSLTVGASYFEVCITVDGYIQHPSFFIIYDPTLIPHESFGENCFQIKTYHPQFNFTYKHFIRDFFWEDKFVVLHDKKLAEYMVRELKKEEK